MSEDDPRLRVGEAKRRAGEGGLHGERLGDTVNDAHPSVRVETLMALDGQPLRLADFKIVRRLQYAPSLDVRTQCAGSLARFGPIAESTLLRLLEPDPADHRFELGRAVAYGLGLVGGEGSLAALEAAAHRVAPLKSWMWYFQQAAKRALLSIEARLGRFGPRPRRAGLWEGLPTDRNRTGEPIAGYWLLAAEERLRGDVMREAIPAKPRVSGPGGRPCSPRSSRRPIRKTCRRSSKRATIRTRRCAARSPT